MCLERMTPRAPSFWSIGAAHPHQRTGAARRDGLVVEHIKELQELFSLFVVFERLFEERSELLPQELVHVVEAWEEARPKVETHGHALEREGTSSVIESRLSASGDHPFQVRERLPSGSGASSATTQSLCLVLQQQFLRYLDKET